MKKIASLFYFTLLAVSSKAQQAPKPFTSYMDAGRFLLRKMEYSGPASKDMLRPYAVTGTVLVFMSIKDGEARSWHVIYASDTCLVAGIKGACNQSMKLWSFISKETTVIIPFYFDNGEDMNLGGGKYRIDKPVLQIEPLKSPDVVVMKTLAGFEQIAFQKLQNQKTDK